MCNVIPFSQGDRRVTEDEKAHLHLEHFAIHFLLDSYRIPAIVARRPMDRRGAVAEIRARWGLMCAESLVGNVEAGEYDEGVGPCAGPCCVGRYEERRT